MKRKLLKIITMLLLVAPSLSYASNAKSILQPVVSDLNVKLRIHSGFQSIFRMQDKLNGAEKKLSSGQRDFTFYNTAAMSADISNEYNGIKYGGKVSLVPTAKGKGNPTYNGSHIYIESAFGKIEMGSPFLPSAMMMVDGSNIAAATFDGWGGYANTKIQHLMQGSKMAPSFATSNEFFLDNKLVTSLDNKPYSSEPARSIVYYTPNFHLNETTKLQIGIGYTPDSSNTGADKPHKVASGASEIQVGLEDLYSFKFDSSVKNAISTGISMEKSFTDGIDCKIAITNEYAQSKGSVKKLLTKDDKNPKEFKLADLRTFNIGAILNVGNFSYAGSFGSLGKSLTSLEFHKTGRNTKYYTGTISYGQGPFATSISYFKSDRFKNSVDAISIGTHYLLMPGFKPYLEISSFFLEGKPEFHKNLIKKKTRGTIALIGAKLSL